MTAVADKAKPAEEQLPSANSEVPIGTFLEDAVAKTKRCVLKPAGFFVSWQGVLTLAYKGFPTPLLNLKAELAEHHTALPRENPGSKWPKTSLGCVKDNKRLTPDQLSKLLQICREESGFFQQPNSKRAQVTDASSADHTVVVDKLNVVVFECRSLERRLANRLVPLTGELDSSEPAADELARTEKVLAEADAPDYWVHASKDGNRDAHYRGPALGSTLVHDLEAFRPGCTSQFGKQLPGIVERFRRRVDEELPGMYTWFADDSLHITIRGICG